MRKIIGFLLIMLIIFTFCSCKNNDSENNSSGVSSAITTNADSSLILSLETTTSTEPTEDKKKSTESATSENKGTTEQTEKKEPVTSTTPVTQTPKTDNSKPTENKTETTTSTPTTTTPTTETPPTTTTVPTYTRPTGAEVSQRVVYYINQLRQGQGNKALTQLSGMTKVAVLRSEQLITNFSHSVTDQRKAYAEYKYGEYVDMTDCGLDESSNYYTAYCGEAIAKGRWSGNADDIAKKIADGFRNSSGHWGYVGSPDNSYIAVGCVYNPSSGYWYCCVLVNNVNYG